MNHRLSTILLLLPLLPGCSYVAKNYRSDPIIARSNKSPAYAYMSKDGRSIDVTSVAFARRAAVVVNESTRNILLSEIMQLSNDICLSNISEIVANSNTWNIGAGSVSSLLSGLGTVVGASSTKAALSAGAALSNSSRSLVNQEVYAEAVAPTIVRAINVQRLKARMVIQEQMRSKSLDEYPLWSGILDIDEYHARCSFVAGLVEVAGSLENRQESVPEIRGRINELQQQMQDNIDMSMQMKKAGMAPNNYDPTKMMGEIEALQMKLKSAPQQ